MLQAHLFIYLAIFFTTAYSAQNYDRQVIQKRIEPVGKVRIEGTKKVKQVEQKKNQPELITKLPAKEIYQKYCVICHRGGLAGAPKFRNEADWKPRLAKSNLEELTSSAIKGKNAMPAKGTCLDCSEKDIKNAIEYMLPEKKG